MEISVIPRQNSFFENVPPNFSDIRTKSGDREISWYTEIFSESLSYIERFHVRIKKTNKQTTAHKETQNQSEWHVSAKVTAMHVWVVCWKLPFMSANMRWQHRISFTNDTSHKHSHIQIYTGNFQVPKKVVPLTKVISMFTWFKCGLVSWA